jgi:zinc protease
MLNRSIAPPFSQNFSFELPAAEVTPIADGVNFTFLGGLQQEVFKLEIIFNAGKWYEPKLGLSHFTSILLNKGTSDKSSKEIAELFDYYGAQIEISPGYDFTSVSLYALKKHVHEIVPLFCKILTSPMFRQEEFDLQRDIFLQNLKVNNEKNSFVASKLIRKNIFGAVHPYGSSIEENDAATLTVNELLNYFKSNFSPSEVYLMGNFDSHQVKFLKDQFVSLQLKRQENKMHFDVIPGQSAQHISKQNSVQSSTRLGKLTATRGHADYFSLLLLNHILGGYFGSRLMKNIREEKGLTYGIYSSINSFKHKSLFSIGADVDKGNLELTIKEIKKELQTLREHLIPEDELLTAKNHFLGSLQLDAANPFSLLDKIKNIHLNQLSKDYYKNLVASIQSSDSISLREIAQKYFTVADLFEVAVG